MNNVVINMDNIAKIKKIYNLCVIKENIDYNHQECTRDGPDEGTATTRFCEKGANFRKKDLRDGIAKKDFSLSCLQAGFFYFNGGQRQWLTKKSDFSLQKA